MAISTGSHNVFIPYKAPSSAPPHLIIHPKPKDTPVVATVDSAVAAAAVAAAPNIDQIAQAFNSEAFGIAPPPPPKAEPAPWPEQSDSMAVNIGGRMCFPKLPPQLEQMRTELQRLQAELDVKKALIDCLNQNEADLQ